MRYEEAVRQHDLQHYAEPRVVSDKTLRAAPCQKKNIADTKSVSALCLTFD